MVVDGIASSTILRRQRDLIVNVNSLSCVCVCHCYCSVYSRVKFYIHMPAKPVSRNINLVLNFRLFFLGKNLLRKTFTNILIIIVPVPDIKHSLNIRYLSDVYSKASVYPLIIS